MLIVLTDLDDRSVAQRLLECAFELAEISMCAEDDNEPGDVVARIDELHDNVKELAFVIGNSHLP